MDTGLVIPRLDAFGRLLQGLVTWIAESADVISNLADVGEEQDVPGSFLTDSVVVLDDHFAFMVKQMQVPPSSLKQAIHFVVLADPWKFTPHSLAYLCSEVKQSLQSLNEL